MVICLCVFGYSSFQLYQIYSQKDQVKKETEKLEEHVVQEDNSFVPDWDALLQENGNIVGWIYVPGCEISFPIVQGSDNSYYLNHTTNGEYNNRGAIFLDSAASADFSDDNSIVYGHSVEGGGMFTLLKNFTDSSFFDEHPVFYVLTPEKNYVCDILAFSKTDDASVFYTTAFNDFKDSVVTEMKTTATFSRDLEVDASLVTLSTCNLDYGFHSNQRFVLTGIMHETSDPIVLEE